MTRNFAPYRAYVPYARRHAKARSLLYNVSPFDPASFVTVAVFLAAVAALAGYVSARRAMNVNPAQALRGE